MAEARRRAFTGRHMAAVLVCFFGVVIAVNMLNAHYASSTFGGEVVENSYVASQEFNRWLDEANSEKALGWDELTTWRPDGRVVVAVRGAPEGMVVKALARHPLGRPGPVLEELDQLAAVDVRDVVAREVQAVLGRGRDA